MVQQPTSKTTYEVYPNADSKSLHFSFTRACSDPSATWAGGTVTSWNVKEALKVMVLPFCLQIGYTEMTRERHRDEVVLPRSKLPVEEARSD